MEGIWGFSVTQKREGRRGDYCHRNPQRWAICGGGEQGKVECPSAGSLCVTVLKRQGNVKGEKGFNYGAGDDGLLHFSGLEQGFRGVERGQQN